MTISSLYFINLRGEIIIFRSFRDDVSRQSADAFRMQVLASKDFRVPVQRYEKCSFFHIREGNVFLVAATRSNVNAAMVFQLLFQIVNLIKAYFNGAFDEDVVRQNFSLIYELLDEIIDFGYPQNTSPDMLKTYILQETLNVERLLGGRTAASNIPPAVTGAVSWRREGIKYRKNEVFLDVVEHVNVLVSNKGTVLRSEVAGEVQMKCFLSGMPECRFGMNDKLGLEKENKQSRKANAIDLDDLTFHQCVKLGKFDSDRTVSFVPPDGEFVLMKYRVTDNVNLPFRVLPVIKEHGRSRLEVNVTVKALFNVKLFALNVLVKIPLPPNTAIVNPSTVAGKTKFQPDTHQLLWKIKRFAGESEFSLSAEVEMSARIDSKKQWNRAPISMEFQVPMFAASGLQVRYLKIVEKSNYNTIKWVRYITKNGECQHRV
jgi:AP-2 complex subunit mu-1